MDVPADRHPAAPAFPCRAAQVFRCQAARAGLRRGDQVARRPGDQADLVDQAGQLRAGPVVQRLAGQVFRHLDDRAARYPEAGRLGAVADASSAAADAMMVD